MGWLKEKIRKLRRAKPYLILRSKRKKHRKENGPPVDAPTDALANVTTPAPSTLLPHTDKEPLSCVTNHQSAPCGPLDTSGGLDDSGISAAGQGSAEKGASNHNHMPMLVPFGEWTGAITRGHSLTSASANPLFFDATGGTPTTPPRSGGARQMPGQPSSLGRASLVTANASMNHPNPAVASPLLGALDFGGVPAGYSPGISAHASDRNADVNHANHSNNAGSWGGQQQHPQRSPGGTGIEMHPAMGVGAAPVADDSTILNPFTADIFDPLAAGPGRGRAVVAGSTGNIDTIRTRNVGSSEAVVVSGGASAADGGSSGQQDKEEGGVLSQEDLGDGDGEGVVASCSPSFLPRDRPGAAGMAGDMAGDMIGMGDVTVGLLGIGLEAGEEMGIEGMGAGLGDGLGVEGGEGRADGVEELGFGLGSSLDSGEHGVMMTKMGVDGLRASGSCGSQQSPHHHHHDDRHQQQHQQQQQHGQAGPPVEMSFSFLDATLGDEPYHLGAFEAALGHAGGRVGGDGTGISGITQQNGTELLGGMALGPMTFGFGHMGLAGMADGRHVGEGMHSMNHASANPMGRPSRQVARPVAGGSNTTGGSRHQAAVTTATSSSSVSFGDAPMALADVSWDLPPAGVMVGDGQHIRMAPHGTVLCRQPAPGGATARGGNGSTAEMEVQTGDSIDMLAWMELRKKFGSLEIRTSLNPTHDGSRPAHLAAPCPHPTASDLVSLAVRRATGTTVRAFCRSAHEGAPTPRNDAASKEGATPRSNTRKGATPRRRGEGRNVTPRSGARSPLGVRANGKGKRGPRSEKSPATTGGRRAGGRRQQNNDDGKENAMAGNMEKGAAARGGLMGGQDGKFSMADFLLLGKKSPQRPRFLAASPAPPQAPPPSPADELILATANRDNAAAASKNGGNVAASLGPRSGMMKTLGVVGSIMRPPPGSIGDQVPSHAASPSTPPGSIGTSIPLHAGTSCQPNGVFHSGHPLVADGRRHPVPKGGAAALHVLTARKAAAEWGRAKFGRSGRRTPSQGGGDDKENQGVASDGRMMMATGGGKLMTVMGGDGVVPIVPRPGSILAGDAGCQNYGSVLRIVNQQASGAGRQNNPQGQGFGKLWGHVASLGGRATGHETGGSTGGAADTGVSGGDEVGGIFGEDFGAHWLRLEEEGLSLNEGRGQPNGILASGTVTAKPRKSLNSTSLLQLARGKGEPRGSAAQGGASSGSVSQGGVGERGHGGGVEGVSGTSPSFEVPCDEGQEETAAGHYGPAGAKQEQQGDVHQQQQTPPPSPPGYHTASRAYERRANLAAIYASNQLANAGSSHQQHANASANLGVHRPTSLQPSTGGVARGPWPQGALAPPWGAGPGLGMASPRAWPTMPSPSEHSATQPSPPRGLAVGAAAESNVRGGLDSGNSTRIPRAPLAAAWDTSASTKSPSKSSMRMGSMGAPGAGAGAKSPKAGASAKHAVAAGNKADSAAAGGGNGDDSEGRPAQIGGGGDAPLCSPTLLAHAAQAAAQLDGAWARFHQGAPGSRAAEPELQLLQASLVRDGWQRASGAQAQHRQWQHILRS
eukprot:jgi/Mesvir1/14925/Mv05517-RA.2